MTTTLLSVNDEDGVEDVLSTPGSPVTADVEITFEDTLSNRQLVFALTRALQWVIQDRTDPIV